MFGTYVSRRGLFVTPVNVSGGFDDDCVLSVNALRRLGDDYVLNPVQHGNFMCVIDFFAATDSVCIGAGATWTSAIRAVITTTCTPTECPRTSLQHDVTMVAFGYD